MILWLQQSLSSQNNVDFVHLDTINTTANETVFGIEYLPGQFDQRADSAAQCVQLLTQKRKTTGTFFKSSDLRR